MSVANMQAYALSQGITKSYSAMSQAEQMTLRYNYLMSVTADAQGDFARTSGSLANQQKLLKENVNQLAGKIMMGAVPALAEGTKNLNAMIAAVDTESLGQFVSQIVDLVVGLTPIAMNLLPVITRLLNTILPPLLNLVRIILPPLTKFLDLVVRVVNKIIQIGVDVFRAIFGTDKQTTANGINEASGVLVKNYGTYANGGFSARPAIFGEAGLEAAIPIKRGNRRSISLLQRTAQLLGVSNQFYGGSFVYSPVINDGDPERLRPILRRHYEDMKRMWTEWQNRGRRLSFG